MDGSMGGNAAVIALALAAFKVLDRVFAWAEKRFTKKDKDSDRIVIVQLDPETSLMLRNIHANVEDVAEVVKLKDHEGVPMVYSSRHETKQVDEIKSDVHDIKIALRLLNGKG